MPVYIITTTWEREFKVKAEDAAELHDLIDAAQRGELKPQDCLYYHERCIDNLETTAWELLKCPTCGNIFRIRYGFTIKGCFIECQHCYKKSRLERLTKGRDCSRCSKQLDCLAMPSTLECPA